MPLVHKVNKVLEHLRIAIGEAADANTVGAELPALTGLAAVDYLSGFWSGRRSTRQDYLGFLGKYFPSAYGPLSEWMYYNLRCGLMHSLVAMNPWRGDVRSYSLCSDLDAHLSERADRLIFAIPIFLLDVKRAGFRFAHQLVMHPDQEPDLIIKFHRRFDRLEGAGAFMAKE